MDSLRKTSTTRRRFTATGLAALLVGGGVSLPVASRALAQDQPTFETRARFLHANTDGNQYEVFIDGNEVIDEFNYGDVSDWIDVNPGSVRLTLTHDRAGFNYTAFDAYYPVAAGGSFNVTITDAIVIASAVETSALQGDNARVRVVHGSADTPPISVLVAGSDEVLATDLGFGRSSEYVEVPAGTYDLDVQVSETQESVLSLPGVQVQAGMVYDFVAMGTPGDEDTPLEVTTLETEATTSQAATPAATPEAATPVS